MDPILSPEEIKALMASIRVSGTDEPSYKIASGEQTSSPNPPIESGAMISDQNGQIVWVSGSI